MPLLTFLLRAIGGVAPIASVASLVGILFGLGGWGIPLFLWFGFTGMFSLGAAGALQKDKDASVLQGAVFALPLLAAFGIGVFFAVIRLSR